jgi:uncharacterized protein YndB with AHSA1/START domain
MEWTGARYADTPTVEVETWIAAPPEQVWALVSDPTLMAAFSDELQAVEWVDGAAGARVGARFRGSSKHEALGEWSTVSQVVECAEPEVFAWAVQDVDNPAAVWRYTLEPVAGGTRLRHWMRMGPARSGLNAAIDRMPDKEQKIVFVRMREFERNMTASLAGVKARLEGGAAAGGA